MMLTLNEKSVCKPYITFEASARKPQGGREKANGREWPENLRAPSKAIRDPFEGLRT